MTTSAPPASPTRSRLPLVITLLVAFLAALVIGDATRPRVERVAAAGGPTAAMPPSADVDAAWFCPGAPPSKSIPARAESITLANTSGHDTSARVTAISDTGDPAGKQVALPAYTTVSVPRRDVAPNHPGMLLVDTASPDVVVEDRIASNGRLAVEPCATDGAKSWYFAAGSTARDVEQWLVIANPYSEDAKVDVRYLRPEGERIEAGIDVAHRSRVVIAVHSRVVRDARVAMLVHARTGRVIAEQTMVFTNGSGNSGLARALGTTSAGLEWWFPDGKDVTGSRTRIALANFNATNTDVDVQVIAAKGSPLPPVNVQVPAGSVVNAQVGSCGNPPAKNCVQVPDGVTYDVYVNTGPGVPVAAAMLTTGNDAGESAGAALLSGQHDPAARWYYASNRVPGQSRSTITLLNPFAQPVEVSLAFVRDGEAPFVPDARRSITVPPSKPVVVSLTGAGIGQSPAAVIVTASGRIFAARSFVRDDELSLSPGVRG